MAFHWKGSYILSYEGLLFSFTCSWRRITYDHMEFWAFYYLVSFPILSRPL